MAINTTTLLELEQLFSESIGDWLEFDTTTNITTNTSIISTTLTSYDDGANDHFNNWWVYITEGNNSGVLRKVSDYATATGTLTVHGAALAAETGAKTCRLHRYNRTSKVNALNRASEQIYPALHVPVDDTTLITNNSLPDGHFESWASSTSLNWYSASNATLAKTSTAGLTRGGTYSTKVTASAAAGYIYVSSNSFPRLMDLMGQTIDFKCWAYPEVANDAGIAIYQKYSSSSSSTTAPILTNSAGQWNLLKAEAITLEEDLVEIQFRFTIATNAKYVIFDDARVVGVPLKEYLLPDDLTKGVLNQTMIQSSGYADDMCDDLMPTDWIWQPHQTTSDGTNDYLRMKDYYTDNRRIRLRGYKPLETLSSDTDTITLDAHRIPLLIAKAKRIFFEIEETPVSINDVARLQYKASQAQKEVDDLFPRLSMPKPAIRTRDKF